VSRPRLLLVPTSAPLEWPILPLLEEWADVATVDGPWIEDGAAARRAADELGARGWPNATLVCDEWAIFKTVEIIERAPGLVQALALGHACTEFRTSGSRPTLNPAVVETYSRLLETDFVMYARAITQTTRGDYDDALVARFMERTSHEQLLTMFERIRARDGESFADALRSVDVPLLFGRHTECLLWTEDSFRDAVDAFPHAKTVAVRSKPSASPDFAAALREFCLGLPATEA
jgi:hypothetical protein